jgi:NAD(P)-dependent dehydrogenase (short-subunit alcohol dehydrogenase family)
MTGTGDSLVWITGATSGLGGGLARTCRYENARIINLSLSQDSDDILAGPLALVQCKITIIIYLFQPPVPLGRQWVTEDIEVGGRRFPSG